MNHADIQRMKRELNIDEPHESYYTSYLNRYHRRYPEHELENAIPHVFFTKPHCNFFKEGSTSYTDEILKSYQLSRCIKDKDAMTCLQENSGEGIFIYPFTSEFKNFEVDDRVIKTRESAETANDAKIIYGHRMTDSMGPGNLNMRFSDTRSQKVFHILEGWTTYIDLITRGFLSPTQSQRDNKELIYAGSMYYFLTSEDGTTIIYYHKKIGIFPLNVPDSAYSYDGEFKPLDYNIQFQYSASDYSPAVISDFNNITKQYRSLGNKEHFKANGAQNSTWCSGAFIEETSKGELKLRYAGGL